MENETMHPDKVRAWVRETCVTRGQMNALADQSGLSRETVRRFREGDTFSEATWRKLAAIAQEAGA